MFSRIRKRITYANVAMTLALVFAMSGGAYAANKYLITSTKQISPKVLKALKGAKGANGANGAAGAAGAAGTAGPQAPAGAAGAKGETGAAGAAGAKGETGKEGSPWTVGGTLPKGASEKGQWGTFKFAQKVIYLSAVPISFTIPLKAAPEAHYIAPGEGAGEAKPAPAITNGECTGTYADPGAASGNLCVFAKVVLGSEFSGFSNGEGEGQAGATGTVMVWQVTAPESGTVAAYGTWAVTG
jgi:hypothetical protein